MPNAWASAPHLTCGCTTTRHEAAYNDMTSIEPGVQVDSSVALKVGATSQALSWVMDRRRWAVSVKLTVAGSHFKIHVELTV